MCILFFTTNANPSSDGYKLILASNRDEFYARPALPAATWEENPFVYGGERNAFLLNKKIVFMIIFFYLLQVVIWSRVARAAHG